MISLEDFSIAEQTYLRDNLNKDILTLAKELSKSQKVVERVVTVLKALEEERINEEKRKAELTQPEAYVAPPETMALRTYAKRSGCVAMTESASEIGDELGKANKASSTKVKRDGVDTIRK